MVRLHGVYGLVVHYKVVFLTTISNNIFDGGTRWGICLRGNDSTNQGAEDGPNQTGPDIISNNIIS